MENELILKKGYEEAIKIIESNRHFKKDIKNRLKNFPSLECPEVYKRALCALSGDDEVEGFLNAPKPMFGNQSLRQLIEQQDYARLEKYIVWVVVQMFPGDFSDGFDVEKLFHLAQSEFDTVGGSPASGSSNYGYLEAKRIIAEEPFYQQFVTRDLPKFPSIDCPEEYKVGLCAVAKGIEFPHFLGTPVEILNHRTLMQVLEDKDYESIERYIHECIFLDVMGPGSY